MPQRVMRRRLLIVLLIAALAVAAVAGSAASSAQEPDRPDATTDVGTAFTYHGRLTNEGGNPLSGEYDFRFRLYDGSGDDAGQIGSAVTVNDKQVDDGRFTVKLDFGPDAFTGDRRWLEIRVREGASNGPFTRLLPRQELTPVPYALYAERAPWSGINGVPGDLADGDDDTTYSAGPGLSLSGNAFSVDFNAVARSGHDHLGQTWTSNDNPLILTGTFGTAPLVLGNAASDGLRVESAYDDGVQVTSAGGEGVQVYSADSTGVRVGSVGGHGLSVHSANQIGVYVDSANLEGIYVGSAESGLLVASADTYGVYIDSAGSAGMVVGSSAGDGVHVISSAADGVEVEWAGRHGVQVDSAGAHGIHVSQSGAAGFRVDDANNNGVFVQSAGIDGVRVESADDDGFHVATAGSPRASRDSTQHNGFVVEGAEGHGLWVGHANHNGVAVRQADDNGILVQNANDHGVSVESSGNAGVRVDQAGHDGLYVDSAGEDGVHVDSADLDGIYVRNADADNDGFGVAGRFEGDVVVTGNINSGSNSSRIDHPQDPENMTLSHSFVESPDMMNVYNGNVALDENGEAWVQLPDYFEALNRDFRYQLTPIGAPGPNLYIAETIQDNRFKIAGGAPGMTVSWQVTGVRDDPYAQANPIVVEEEKPAHEQGLYLHPEAYGRPPEMGVGYARGENQINR